MNTGPRGFRLRLRVAAVLATALPLVGAGLGGLSPASAQPAAASGGDFCTTDEGVTVVVDLSALGGAIVVRCVDGPLPSGYDGWDALSDAGFRPQGVTRFPGFVCRLAGEPAASRALDIPEDTDYHERCAVTPPTSAYWGYWYAQNGGSWTYSSSGAANHRVIAGGFEGWAFSLNSGANPPQPGVAPRHAVTSTPTPSDTSTEPDGAGQPPKNPGGGGSSPGGSDGPGQGSGSGPPPSADSPPDSGPSDGASADKPGPDDGRRSDNDVERRDDVGAGSPPSRSTDAAPTTSASGDEVVVTSELPADTAADDGSSGPSASTLVGLAVLVLLGVGGGLTAWRRSRHA